MPYDDGRTAIHADLRTPVGLMLYRYGYRDADLDVIARLLGPGDVFVDGGANLGLFTLVAADRVGPAGKVVAFEPGHEVRRRLLANVALNRLEHVDIRASALWSCMGRAPLRVFDIGLAGLNHLAPDEAPTDTLENVELTTLDMALSRHARSRLTLVKLDLEGAEHHALVGAGAILHERRPDLMLEIEPAHLRRMGSSAEAVADLLRGHGYAFYRASRDSLDAPSLSPAPNIDTATGTRNVFATVDVERARHRGVTILRV